MMPARGSRDRGRWVDTVSGNMISASVRTDIPAFYGEWFLNRLRAGYCRYVNPYNTAQQPRVSLLPEDVESGCVLDRVA